jgi:formylglycine-generating enzyme required for sulfatase activity
VALPENGAHLTRLREGQISTRVVRSKACLMTVWAGVSLGTLGCGGDPHGAETSGRSLPSTPTAKPGMNESDQPTAASGPDEESGCPTGMRPIPAGSIWLGSAKGQGKPDEEPQTKLDVAAFCLHTREVSVGDYKACVDNGICDALPTHVQILKATKPEEHEKLSEQCSGRMKDNAELPITCVSYDEAVKYCSWKGLRLPTEIEIEYAATGGADKLPYPWGTSPPDDNKLCWKKSDGPCRIASRPPAAFGVQDLAGNVSEWTSTFYAPYPKPPESGEQMAVRGASWRTSQPEDVMAKRRFAQSPLFKDVDLGFRCAKGR